MTLIGLGGAAGAGKNALAEVLRDEYGFTVMNMSDPLRDALVRLNPLITVSAPLELPDGSLWAPPGPVRVAKLLELVDYSTAKTVPEVRRLLQALGTDVVRDMIDDDAWVKAMSRRIHEQYRGDIASGVDTNIVVTGIRFENELEMIELLGGRAVYVSRQGVGPLGIHRSEYSLLAGDFAIRVRNDDTLDDLATAARRLADGLGLSPLSAASTTLPNQQVFEQSFESNTRRAFS